MVTYFFMVLPRVQGRQWSRKSPFGKLEADGDGGRFGVVSPQVRRRRPRCAGSTEPYKQQIIKVFFKQRRYY